VSVVGTEEPWELEPWDLDWTGAVEEFDFKKLFLARLRRAKLDLRSKCVDDVDDLLASLKYLPEAEWPPEVAQFVKRWKRPRGRMQSNRKRDPRRPPWPVEAAAFLAQEISAKWRAENGGQYKVVLSGGRSVNIRTAAIRWAVNHINSVIAERHKVDDADVEALLKKAKVIPPRSRRDPYNDDD
jgi:hypothetical protein